MAAFSALGGELRLPAWPRLGHNFANDLAVSIDERHSPLRRGGLGRVGFLWEFTPSRSTEKSWPHFRPSAPPTGEGRKRAKERGVRFGRPRKMTPHQRQEALQRLAAGETQADVARTYRPDVARPALQAEACEQPSQGACRALVVGQLRRGCRTTLGLGKALLQ